MYRLYLYLQTAIASFIILYKNEQGLIDHGEYWSEVSLFISFCLFFSSIILFMGELAYQLEKKHGKIKGH